MAKVQPHSGGYGDGYNRSSRNVGSDNSPTSTSSNNPKR